MLLVGAVLKHSLDSAASIEQDDPIAFQVRPRRSAPGESSRGTAVKEKKGQISSLRQRVANEEALPRVVVPNGPFTFGSG